MTESVCDKGLRLTYIIQQEEQEVYLHLPNVDAHVSRRSEFTITCRHQHQVYKCMQARLQVYKQI